MSTYWYLECTDHEPPIRSGDVQQHTSGLSRIREVIAQRALYAAASAAGVSTFPDDYFEVNTIRFIVQHPKCSLRFVSEYGQIKSVTGGKHTRDRSVDALFAADTLTSRWAQERAEGDRTVNAGVDGGGHISERHTGAESASIGELIEGEQ